MLKFNINKNLFLFYYNILILLIAINIIKITNITLFIVDKILAFIVYVIIPGYLILRILNLPSILSNIEALLYSIGLSLFIIMLTGFIANTFFPTLLNVNNPISKFPILLFLNINIIFLCVLNYIFVDRKYKYHKGYWLYDSKRIIDLIYLLLRNVKILFILWIILFLSIYGSMTFNTLLLMLLLVLILLLFISITLLSWDNTELHKLYPLLVWTISISLLFHSSLVTPFLWGWDIFVDASLAKKVYLNSIWDYTIPLRNNAMLSVTILAPILSLILGINLVWVFKVIYPLFFSLVPLGLYFIYKKLFNDKIALISSFFFMSVIPFYRELPQLPRQQIAELFFVLLLHTLVVSNNLNNRIKKILLTIFGTSIVVSHYGVTFLTILILTLSMFILLLMRIFSNISIYNLLQKYIRYSLTVLAVTAITWYIYLNISILHDIIKIIINSITTILYHKEIINKEVFQFNIMSNLQYFILILNNIAQILIIIGVLTSLKTFKDIKKIKDIKIIETTNLYIILSLSTLVLLFIFFLTPHSVGYSSIDQKRVYHVSLLILAPYSIIGTVSLINILIKIKIIFNLPMKLNLLKLKLFKNRKSIIAIVNPNSINKVNGNNLLKISSLFFATFFLFNSGLISELLKDYPISPSLNRTVDYPRFSYSEIYGAKWLTNVANDEPTIYADEFGRFLFYYYFKEKQKLKIFEDIINLHNIDKSCYIYFRLFNIKFYKYTSYKHIKIYDNKYAFILCS